MENKYIHIFLSPHLDDAVLSCGGLIHQLINADEKVKVVTLFSGIPEPTENPSAFITHIHSLYGNLDDIVQVRRKEDELSIRSLGADFLHLDFADCIYRKDEKTGDYYILAGEDIFGDIKEPDQDLPEKIADQITALFSPSNSQLYAPIGIGGHIDHKIAHMAAVLLKKQGFSLSLYEDYPYSENDNNYKKAYDALTGKYQYQKKKVRLKEQDTVLKINAIAFYQSQIYMLFGTPDAMQTRVNTYSREKGETYLILH